MDRILSYLPENVHVRFGWEHEPTCYYGLPETEYKTIVIPKSWLKHGKRGSYSEWSIKERYKKKLIKEFGEEFIHITERLEVLEWNQLECVYYILKRADKIGFDLIDRVSIVDDKDVKYLNTYAI
jgi:hypothetical protein